MNITTTNNTENKFKFVLSADGNIIDHTTILAAELRTIVGTTLADSDVDALDWDFTNTGYITVKLGLTESCPGVYTCKLIVRTVEFTTGIVWDGTSIQLTVQP